MSNPGQARDELTVLLVLINITVRFNAQIIIELE